MIVDESVLKLAASSFDISLATLDDLPITPQGHIALAQLRLAFENLDESVISEDALTTLGQALKHLKTAPDPVDHPALAAIRSALNDLPDEARSAYRANATSSSAPR